MYTKEQLDRRSDHEVSLAVAKKLNLDYQYYSDNANDGFVEVLNEEYIWDCFNPYENWNDVMPIAIDNQISIEHHSNTAWVARKGEIFSLGVNPKRAICEVFLMMEHEI